MAQLHFLSRSALGRGMLCRLFAQAGLRVHRIWGYEEAATCSGRLSTTEPALVLLETECWDLSADAILCDLCARKATVFVVSAAAREEGGGG